MSRLEMRKLHFRTGWFVAVAAMLLILPLKFVFCWILAAAIHEICHLLCIRAFDIGIERITVGAGGAMIQTEDMDPGMRAVCAFAGPAGGFLILLFGRLFPLLAICAGVQTFFNLLPLYPLDGGCVFSYLLSRINNPPVVKLISGFVRGSAYLFLFLLGIFALICGLGPLPILYTVIFLLRYRKINFLAKLRK